MKEQTGKANSSDKLREYNARRKKKYRRRRKTAVYLMLLLFVCVVCLVLSLTVFFNADEIRVVGNSRYTVEQVITASGLGKGDNLLRMNRDAIEKKMLTVLPYAAEVRIIRELPSRITLKVTELEPSCAYMLGETQCVLLSDGLKVLEIVPERPEGTTLISGIEFESIEIGYRAQTNNGISQKILLDLLTAVKENDIINVNEISFSSPINVNMTVGERVFVKIGGDDGLDYKLKMVKTYLDDCLAQTGSWTLDVTSGDKLYSSRSVVQSDSSQTEETDTASSEQSKDE